MADWTFHKMHGLGNDFVVLDRRAGGPGVTPALVRALADRRRGVGFDQLAVIEPATDADVRLRFWNADGSTAGACGNATRCIARHLMAAAGTDRLTLRTDHTAIAARDLGGGQTAVKPSAADPSAQRLRDRGDARTGFGLLGRRRRGRGRRGRQHLRRDRSRPCARRGRKSASCAARIPACGAHHRHRLRRADRARRLSATWPRSTSCSAIPKSCDPEAWARLRRISSARPPKGAGRRHHVRDRDRGPSDRRFRQPGPRLRAGAERLRSPLHLLHHSLSGGGTRVPCPGRGCRPDQASGRIAATTRSC
jgi:hypothetical protein